MRVVVRLMLYCRHHLASVRALTRSHTVFKIVHSEYAVYVFQVTAGNNGEVVVFVVVVVVVGVLNECGCKRFHHADTKYSISSSGYFMRTYPCFYVARNIIAVNTIQRFCFFTRITALAFESEPCITLARSERSFFLCTAFSGAFAFNV